MTGQTNDAIRARIFAKYSVSNGQELQASEAFKTALASNNNDPGAALKSLMRVKESITGVGWYLGHNEYTDWNPAQQTRVTVKEGPRVLLNDGTIKTFWTDTDLGFDPMTPVEITGLFRVENLKKGIISDVKVDMDELKITELPEGSAEVPPIPITEIVGTMEEGTGLYGRRKTGTIYGATPDLVATTMTIGSSEDDVIFFEGRGDDDDGMILLIGTNDADGTAVSAGIMPRHVWDAFPDLDATSEGEDYKEELVGERILCNGVVNVLRRVNKAPFEKEERLEEFHGFINQLSEYMVGYGGKGLSRLDMKALDRAFPDSKFAVEGIDLGTDYTVHDVVEEQPGEYALYCTKAKGKDVGVSIDAKEIPFATWTKNEGAFTAFLDRLGGTESESVADSLVQDILGGALPPAGEAVTNDVIPHTE